MKFLVRNAAPAGPSIQVEKLSLSHKIVKAEVLLCLASMEKNWSIESMDSVADILRMIDPDSRVLQGICMKSTKLQYLLVHGISPFIKGELLEDIRNSPVFTIGVDAATNKQLGQGCKLFLYLGPIWSL